MMRSTRFLPMFFLFLLVAVPSATSAQVRPGRGGAQGQRQRLELERRLQAGFAETIRRRLELSPEQLQAVQGVMQGFQERRQSLNRSQASLRYRLRDPALPQLDDQAATALLAEMIRLQEEELALYKEEQAQLLEVLSPNQLVRFYSLREELGQRLQELRGGMGMGGGPGGQGGVPGGVGAMNGIPGGGSGALSGRGPGIAPRGTEEGVALPRGPRSGGFRFR